MLKTTESDADPEKGHMEVDMRRLRNLNCGSQTTGAIRTFILEVREKEIVKEEGLVVSRKNGRRDKELAVEDNAIWGRERERERVLNLFFGERR